MRILAISQFFPPDITAASFRIGDMSRLLAERGHELTLLTSHPHKVQVTGNGGVQEIDSGFPGSIRRVHVFPVGRGGAKRYLLHYASFVMGALWQGLITGLSGWRPDVIWVSSPPLTVGIVARILGILFWKPYVLEVRDIWPDTAVAAGQIPSSGAIYSFAKRLELHLYRKAHRIVCVAHPMQQRIQEQTQTPVSVAYNGIYGAKLIGSQKINGPFSIPLESRTILYAGNIGHLQEIDLLVEAFHSLRHDDCLKDWRLKILGAGSQAEKVQNLIQERDPENKWVELLPPVDREAAFRATLEADVLFLSLRDDPVLRLTIPSKLFDYLLAGKPIVGGIAGEGCDILNSTGANVTFQPGNLQDLKKALIEVTNHYEVLRENAPRNWDLVMDRFTREKAVDVLEKALL